MFEIFLYFEDSSPSELTRDLNLFLLRFSKGMSSSESDSWTAMLGQLLEVFIVSLLSLLARITWGERNLFSGVTD